MTHIVEFEIAGLAGRDDILNIKLNRDINIFFGLNGSGKTSLLKVLHSAILAEEDVLRDVPFDYAEVKIYSERYDKIFTRSIRQERVSSENEDEFGTIQVNLFDEPRAPRGRSRKSQKGEWVTKPSLDREPRWAHRYLPTSRLYISDSSAINRSYATVGQPRLSERQLDLLFEESIQRLWVDYSNSLLTQVRQAQEDGLASILQAVLATGDEDENENKEIPDVDPRIAYDRVSAFLRRRGSRRGLGSLSDFERRYRGDTKLRKIVIDINAVEQRIEASMAPRDKLENLIRSLFSGNKQVIFQDRSITIEGKNKISIGLSHLSSGEKHLLRIFIEVLLAGNSTSIIDEPELSMHIDWQEKLIDSLLQLNPRTQLIVATHSPEVMAKISDEKIFRL